MYLKDATFLALLQMCIIGCTTGMGYKEPIDADLSALGPELLLAFPNTLTPSNPARRLYEARKGGEKNRVADINGYIKIERASVDDVDACNRARKPDCISFVLDESIQKNDRDLVAIENWLLNLCSTLPVTVATPSSVYYSIQDRQMAIDGLRKYLECDKTHHTSLEITLFSVTNFDSYFEDYPKRDPALFVGLRPFKTITVQ